MERHGRRRLELGQRAERGLGGSARERPDQWVERGEALELEGRDLADLFAAAGRNLGETFILGDNPLALLTALKSSFEPETTSSRFAFVPRPRITDDGAYAEGDPDQPIRVYTWLDVRLMLEDLFLKLQARRQRAAESSSVVLVNCFQTLQWALSDPLAKPHLNHETRRFQRVR